MKGLSPRQRDVLDMITNTVREEGRFPSVREIGAALGISSPATVSQHLRALVAKRFLERRGRHYVVPDRLRAAVGIPVVGRVAAGVPITAHENVDDWLDLGTMTNEREGRLFAVKVMGESMSGDGIFEGDYVLVDSSVSEPPNGAVVVAYLGTDQEVTVKRFHRTPGGIELRPANPAFQPLRVAGDDEDFRLAGRVVGLLRRF
ncbi:MAG: repressor LexA [Candidatus Eisenbacteria bacterium]|nr:repressor LexA [Candidatus Eisenbacteria bacterium]